MQGKSKGPAGGRGAKKVGAVDATPRSNGSTGAGLKRYQRTKARTAPVSRKTTRSVGEAPGRPVLITLKITIAQNFASVKILNYYFF